MPKKILIVLVAFLLLTLVPIVDAAPSGATMFEGQVDSEDLVLQLRQSGKNTVVFKNTASADINDVASTIQFITLAAANLNPSRARIALDASWEIYESESASSPRVSSTITGSLDASAIYAPYSTTQAVELYTWAFGKPGGVSGLDAYTSSGQFSSDLKILRPGELLKLTITIQCQGVVGDSRAWFFFRATEAAYTTGNYPVDISTIDTAHRVNLYYSKIPAKGDPQGPYWLPLHNSYDPYDQDIGTGHNFNQHSWTIGSTTHAFAKANKLVHQEPPSAFTVRLVSDEDGTGPPDDNKGSIILGDLTYSLSTDVSKNAGTYTATYTPESGYSFVRWETTGGVSVSDPNSQTTTVTVNGDGTLRAIYKADPNPYTVHLESRQEDGPGLNDGSIILDGSIYSSLPTDVSKAAGGYQAQYNPASGYEFVKWETTGGVSVSDANSQTTTVTVSAAGTLRAIYRVEPPTKYTVHLESKQDTSATTNRGSIVFDGTTYSLFTDSSETAGSYSISYSPQSGYSFVRWETTGGVSVSDPNSQTTTVTVNGDGTLRAIYKADPASYTVTLESRQEDGATINLGSITFDGSTESLPKDVPNKAAGGYQAQYNPASGYEFVRWETTGSVSVSNPNSQTATVTVSGTGTLRAIYKVDPPPTYSFHICGVKFDDSDRDGVYDVETEHGIGLVMDNVWVESGVTVTLLGPDQKTKAEEYYAGMFSYPPPETNPLHSGENQLRGSYCFNLENVKPGTYTFYVKEEVPAGRVATTSTLIGPTTLVASAEGKREDLNNHFGNVLPRPVGGYSIPVNKLAVLAPYIALLGLAGVMVVVIAHKKRKA